MKKQSAFLTYLLKDSGGASPALVSGSPSVCPGSYFKPEAGITLSGGFPDLFPEATIPLSPTLQLNGDLAVFSDEQLRSIGEAELEKIHKLSFPSKIVDADTRVCVVSESAERLQLFQDTYGGVLDIEPRLLQGYHPDFITTEEISIDSKNSGVILNYSLRSPIQTEQCTYCGACGPACPENCLSPELYIDFQVCTFCKECETACLHNLIDVYAVESRNLQMPALIILGDTSISLPEDCQAVYTENNLAEFFKTVFPYRIDEVVTCNNSICQYSGRLDTGCQLCFDSCSNSAIIQDISGIRVDSMQCLECGNCISICPTGALQYERFPDQVFIEYFRTFQLPASCTVILGDQQSLHDFWWRNRNHRFEQVFFLEYPKIRAISATHLLFLFGHGASRIVLLHHDLKKAKGPLAQQGFVANTIINSLFDVEENRIIQCDVETMGTELLKRYPHPIDHFFTNLNLVNRRAYLANLLEFLLSQSGREPVFKDLEFPGFGTLICDEDKCTHCLACLNDCNIEALSANEHEMTLSHLGSMCVSCSVCEDVCPENALSLSDSFNLNQSFFSPLVLASAEPMHCIECGKLFGTRKSFEKVMKMLESRNIGSDVNGLFECCDHCRVVKMHESMEMKQDEQ